ncbi:Putative ribonuclease H protein At1g65750 [Linum perenne]
MQTGVLPVATCEAIDRRVRNFIWGSSDEARKVHLAKYFKETTVGFISKNKFVQSPLWRGITREWSSMLRGARSAIRDGRGTAFWTAKWVDSGVRLIDLVDENTANIDIGENVADFTIGDGTWNFDKLRGVLPTQAVNLVMGMTPPQADRGDDEWVWGEEIDGQFSIKSAYRIVCSLGSSRLADPWLSIWKWKGPNRAKLFLWLAIHEKIMTNTGRKRRNLTDDDSCAYCLTQAESVLHMLRDCEAAKEIWKHFHQFNSSSDKWNLGLHDWASIWVRNSEEIESRDRLISGRQGTRDVTEIAWDPGPPGWLNLNTDGSFNRNRQGATAGGLLRDEHGRCLMAFTMNLGLCSITRAELRGAVEGIKRAWEAGYRKILLRLDSKAAISLLTGAKDTSHQHGMEVIEYRELCQRDWLIQIKHTYREGNHAADFLASMGYDYPLGSHTISTTDSNLGYFLRYDCMGISEPRSILIND